MSSLRYWLMDFRVQAAIGLLAVAAFAYFGAEKLKSAGAWMVAIALFALLVWLIVWIVRKMQSRRAARQLDAMVQQQADHAVASAAPAARADAEVLRERMAEAVKAIKTSKLGLMKGNAALYELPWYVIIGNPAAGKSTAILNSGLRFPFEDNRSNVIHGLGGTRNCDWYFTTEGIVLDTAGRYTVSAEDRLEWLTFLDLLKKNRPRAPINGIIIAASIAELSGSKPEFAIDLAKNLRQRVQELTERLEVFAPVYVVFTKADLISGFAEFFRNLDPSERENVWGATLPYDPNGGTDALAAFDGHFDQLSEGLKEMSLTQMAMQRGREVSPGLLTLPMEFTGIKPALRTFIATLFEENPYQFKPVFRGFYFTSALQEGVSVQPASERVARQFGLQGRAAAGERGPISDGGHFLLGLFRKVIFADRQLVKQYSSPSRNKLRYAAFLGAVIALGVALTGWTWSYTGNRQLVENVGRDLDKAIGLQKGRVDLQSRIDALLLLQDRMEELQRYRKEHPLQLGLGLYQGDRIEQKLRTEYFNGMRQLMLDPVGAKLESYLSQVIARRGEIRPVAIAGAGSPADPFAAGNGDAAAQAADKPAATDKLYQDASPTDAEDAYNALKTYLMLGDRSRAESSHLNDQLTRFWRGWLEDNRGQMSREQLLRSAERLMSFYVAQATDPAWPQLDPKFSLVDDSRQALRQVMKGTPARDRVYALIKQKAAVQYAPTTVAKLLGDDAGKTAVAGSYQVSGTFSRAAWEGYVKDAIKEAANSELSSTDWVLEATVQNDLTLAGSPEHIQRELVALYKADYAREWRKFLQGVTVSDFGTFDQTVTQMNGLGDPANSPLRKLLEAVNRETIWDNPAAASQLGAAAQKGFVAWFNRVIMRRNPTQFAVEINPDTGKQVPVGLGPIGKEFEGLARLMAVREGNPPLLNAYFEALGKVRTRLNAIKTQGDPGPGARKLMQETLEGTGSELADAQRLVDEQMLNGLNDSQRQALRPLLVRPLMQTFQALVRPTEGEINRVWTAQVYEPFRSGIGQMAPYNTTATVQAAQADRDAIFGPNGAIAKFASDALGSLVTRRGTVLDPARWADIGVNLRPELLGGYANWVGGNGAATQSSTVLELMPGPAEGLEYSITIDGQTLRYRNTPPQWMTFQVPNPPNPPGVQIRAITTDGRTVELMNQPGTDALGEMFSKGGGRKIGENLYQMNWSADGASASVQMRIVSRPVAGGATGAGGQSHKGLQLPAVVAGPVAATAPGGVPAEATGTAAAAPAPAATPSTAGAN
ncbi:type VI secretion system membrane subunit TssM [Montanilutibacter psychrotolerans]|uniref:Type VI secretion system membrane subunit TssM n=1 Tax=Montanilutibacter psychrotolerans TaxID=1327343 RepID=A0A3M8SVU5_9GAMM|nr:type VI secretion system membrane subunit TssM [Lysobacter psychrotolerans]RNF83576.1 type VI secretion system membrane subunit TssM [Lysobacter psychrotolerans]